MTDDYRDPEWITLQTSDLGEAVETANRLPDGVWTRQFTNGWVAVNPTAAAVRVIPPEGLVTMEGAPAGPMDLPSADGVVLVKPKP
jgi:hypothetical protein